MPVLAPTFDPKAAKEERVVSHDRQLLSVRFSADGRFVFAGGYDGRLYRWNLSDAEAKLVGFDAHKGWVEGIALHPDGKRLFTADSWGEVHCWTISENAMKPDWTIGRANSSWLHDLVVSPDGKLIATCGNDRVVCVFSAADGKTVRNFEGHEHHVHSVVFYSDGDRLVSGDLHGVVKQWNISDGKCIRELDAAKLYKPYYQYHQGGVRCMTFDNDFNTLYCAGFEGQNANQAHGIPTVVAFDWKSGKQRIIMTPKDAYKGPVLQVAYHSAGYVIGAGSSEAGGSLWFWKQSEAQSSHQLKNATSFRGFALNADGTRLVATTFGDRGGQRGGNGRRLTKDGDYLGFAGSMVLYSLSEQPA
jgi:WD40 repeat protein